MDTARAGDAGERTRAASAGPCSGAGSRRRDGWCSRDGGCSRAGSWPSTGACPAAGTWSSSGTRPTAGTRSSTGTRPTAGARSSTGIRLTAGSCFRAGSASSRAVSAVPLGVRAGSCDGRRAALASRCEGSGAGGGTAGTGRLTHVRVAHSSVVLGRNRRPDGRADFYITVKERSSDIERRPAFLRVARSRPGPVGTWAGTRIMPESAWSDPVRPRLVRSRPPSRRRDHRHGAVRERSPAP